MGKKRIFIGSSSKELNLAYKAKEILNKDFDVTIWDDNVWESSVFKINNSFFNSLLKASLQFDFGILLGTQDDKVIDKNNVVLQPRDNILFELGLFIGRLGLSKSVFVIDKEISVLSDMSGISLVEFENNNDESFTKAIKRVNDFFLKEKSSEINFFPSSTLASGYFENLLFPTCKYLIENNGFEINKTKYNNCKIRIIIPKRLNNDINLQFEQLKRKFNTQKVSFNYAGRPRFIHFETEITNNELFFIDFPTTLSGINYAISHLLPNDFNTMNSDYDFIINREVERFITTIEKLAIRNGVDSMIEIKIEK